jgi:hypothetical protein
MNSFSRNNAVHSGESQKAYRQTYRLHLLGWRISQARNCMKRVANQAWLTLRLWRCRRYVPPKRRSTFTGLYSIISKKIELCHIFQIFISYFCIPILSCILVLKHPSRQMPGWYLKLGHGRFFHTVSNSLFCNHPIIRRDILCATSSVLKWPINRICDETWT